MMRTKIYLLSLVAVFVTAGFLLTTNHAQAQGLGCVQKSAALNDCGVANPSDSYSYVCMGPMEDAKCKDIGGSIVIQDPGEYPNCQTIEGCCEAVICGEEDDDTLQGTEIGGNQPIPQTGSTAEWDYNTGGTGIRLVACTKSGDCTIQDIVQQGIYVVDFLIGLSGALFLIAFIWGGMRYLLSFGRPEWITKGRDAMIKSSIGIVLIMLAWTIVTYVAESLGYKGL
jgi:Type IV secretion system pilin